MAKSKPDRFNESILDPSNQKVRVNIWLDGDVLQEIKKLAKKEDGPNAKYQTFLNRFLRRALVEKKEEKILTLLRQIKRKLDVG